VSFRFPVVPRYSEVDQQGVVFFGHYLTWFDEAFTGYLAHLGTPYPTLIAGGCDVQVVHAELDYAGSVHWGDDVRVAVACEKVGRTSITSRLDVLRSPDAEAPAVTGRLVHVCVDAAALTKTPVPDTLAEALRGDAAG
jgi:acyl-CoA thioester hydrolase